MPLLTLEKVSLAFGHHTLLDQVDLQLDSGERIGLIGRNGGGKSSLLRILAAENRPDDGKIWRAPALRLAYGSASLSDWERAELAASCALKLSEERTEGEVFEEARSILAAAEKRQFQEVFARPSEGSESTSAADVLAHGLVRKLGEYAGVMRNRPRIPCRLIRSAARADREVRGGAGEAFGRKSCRGGSER